MHGNSIKLSKKAGGSVIDHKPIFSHNSKTLYIGCGPVLRLFSTETGEHVQDVEMQALTLEKPMGNIVDICLHPFDKNIVIVCFEEGHIVSWSYETNTVIRNTNLNVGGNRIVRMKLYVASEAYETFDVVIALKNADSEDVNLSIFEYTTGKKKFSIEKKIDFLMHGWSVTEAGGKDFIASIHFKALSVFNLQTKTLNKDILLGSHRYFTCVLCHPKEECIAAGDNTGRVILFYDFLKPNRNSPKHVFHWHTLPVNDIAFSRLGSAFYSGGNEHVLVKWSIEGPDMKHFLPRLAAPIVHATLSYDNQFLAISTLDNAILIVNTQLKIHCTLQQFTWGFVSVPGQKLFPVGLVVDPRSSCLVMNGRPGHIQFYSPQYFSVAYNMDIVNQNYLSQERTNNIMNAEVVALDFSPDGLWLATAQLRDDPHFRTDTLFKFWQFCSQSQSYKIIVCVTLQHTVEKILFQPIYNRDTNEENVGYSLATRCSDNKFRFWFNEKDTKSWICRSIGYYRTHSLQDISFSYDGSVLGAVFGPCLTLWDSNTNEMKCSLAKGSEPLKQVKFAHGDCSFIVVACTEKTLFAWNVLNLTLLWTCDLNISFLVADPRSDHIAVFSTDNNLFVFQASASKPVYQKNKLCENGNVLHAVFFPSSTKVPAQILNPSVLWLSESSLYFFTSSQELMAFEYCKDGIISGQELPFVNEKVTPTPFKALMASQSASAVEKKDVDSHIQLGIPWSQSMLQFVNSPAHAMPPVHLLCESLLQTLIISRPCEDVSGKYTDSSNENDLPIPAMS